MFFGPGSLSLSGGETFVLDESGAGTPHEVGKYLIYKSFDGICNRKIIRVRKGSGDIDITAREI